MEHKPKCRAKQAAEFGREFARRENRGYRFGNAAYCDDTATMQKLVDELTAALAKNKKLKTSTPAAVKVFVDFIDPRDIGAAAYGAAQEGQLAAVRLLHSLGASLDIGTTDLGTSPSLGCTNDRRRQAVATSSQGRPHAAHATHQRKC